MPSIELDNVSVMFPVYSTGSRSLKKELMAATTGGRIGNEAWVVGGRYGFKAGQTGHVRIDLRHEHQSETADGEDPSHGAGDGRVLKFLAAGRAAQHQATATHVTAAHEGRWKQQPLAKDRQQHLDVLSRGNAPEQHDVAVGPQAGAESTRTLLERAAVAWVCEIDWLSREGLDRLARHCDIGRTQTGIRRDDENPARDEQVRGIRRLTEPSRVRQLPAKVETAYEGKHVAERSSLRGAQLHGQRELSGIGHDTPCPHPSAIGGRQEEDAMTHLSGTVNAPTPNFQLPSPNSQAIRILGNWKLGVGN